MTRALAAGIDIVMAADAVGKDAAMVNRRAQPGVGVVAIITGLGGRNMVAGQQMATGADADHLAVIDGNDRPPRRRTGGMAGIAQIAGIDVIDRLAVTAGARPDHLGVIDAVGQHRRPTGREAVMAKIAVIGGIDMVEALAAGDAAVMAGNTVTHQDAVVRNDGRRPGIDRVAQIALAIGRQMIGRLAAGGQIIMTAAAGAQYLAVIHGIGRHRRPWYRTRRMTGITGIGGADVLHRLDVAGIAGAYHLGVIDAVGRHRRPRRRELIMAGVAYISGQNMRRTLGSGIHAVVAGDAVGDKRRMIRRRDGAQPGRGVVTAAAIGIGHDMRSVLAGGNHAVVAAAAQTQHLLVIDPVGRHRRPLGREFIVAGVAGIGGKHVLAGLAAGIEAVMATDAIVGIAGVVRRSAAGKPAGGGMAAVAFGRGRHMGGTLAGGGHAVVATAADTDHLGMIDAGGGHRLPGGREFVVAGVAIVGAVDMGQQFTAGIDAVMATEAITGEQSVIRRAIAGAGPGTGDMAVVAFQGRRLVGRALAGGKHAVVAAAASTVDLHVIDPAGGHRGPAGGQFFVAGVTQVRGIQMADGFAAGIDAVMAADAITGEQGVIHLAGRQPGGHGMAAAAFGGGRNMVGLLAGGAHAVVAGIAGADDLTVVYVKHRYRGKSGEALMAGFADIGRGQMRRRLGAWRQSRHMTKSAIVGDGQQFVGEEVGGPGGGVVAKIAGEIRRNMVARLTGGDDALRTCLVAITAEIRGYIIMIHLPRGRPGQGSGEVTSFTGIGCRSMNGWFAGRDSVVMAGGTEANDLAVIHPRGGHRGPGLREFVMAILAVVGGRHMPRALARRDDIVMAEDAIIDDQRVVDPRAAAPGHGGVAFLAIVAGGNMGGMLAAGDAVVVTANAAAAHFVMIHPQRRPPAAGAVASLAAFAGEHVSDRFGGGVYARCMAGHAIATLARVVEMGRYPGQRIVTDIAGRIGGDMTQGLPARTEAVARHRALDRVTGGATAGQHLAVIDTITGHPGLGKMAGVAFVQGRRMRRGFAARHPAVMAILAGAHDLRMIDARHRRPFQRGMTGVAGADTGDGDVIVTGTGGDPAVVAGNAGAHHLGVIYIDYR